VAQEHTKSTPEEKARDMLYVSIKKQQQTTCAPHSRTRRLRLYVDNAQWNQKWWFTWRARSRVSWFEQLAGRMFLAGGLQAPVLLGGEGWGSYVTEDFARQSSDVMLAWARHADMTSLWARLRFEMCARLIAAKTMHSVADVSNDHLAGKLEYMHGRFRLSQTTLLNTVPSLG
jgi:hypothetical protein